MRAEQLTWLPCGIGYLPVTACPYDADYIAKYKGYADTDRGRAITAARRDMVRAVPYTSIVDVGVGSGQFMLACPGARGFDINPVAVTWLRARGLYHDPRAYPIDAACFWDSLEHIPNPAEILSHVQRYVFAALPIFDDLSHVLRSKHYKPDEHCWYFTDAGFILFMARHGWSVVDSNQRETELGREEISSYAFIRTALL